MATLYRLMFRAVALTLRSGLHSLRSSILWLRPVGLAFAPLIYFMAAPGRPCIRSAHLFYGCARSALHSLRSSILWLRPVGLAFGPLIYLFLRPVGLSFAPLMRFGRPGYRDSSEGLSLRQFYPRVLGAFAN